MAEIVTLKPKGPSPSEDGDYIQIVRRFDTENPQQAVIDIDVFIAVSQEKQSIRTGQFSDSPEDFDEALEQAQQIAGQREIDTIYVADLTSEAWD